MTDEEMIKGVEDLRAMRLIDADKAIQELSKFVVCKLGEIKASDIKKFIDSQPTINILEENDKLKEEIKQLKATISKMETTTEKVFEEAIGRWHDSDVDLRVFEYLGITYDEYKEWFERSCGK